MPSATPEALATAIVECIDAGARVINLSLALAQPSVKGEDALEQALNHAARRGAIVVAAAGNQGTLGSSAITRPLCSEFPTAFTPRVARSSSGFHQVSGAE